VWVEFFFTWAGSYRFFRLLNEMTRSSPALFEKKNIKHIISTDAWYKFDPNNAGHRKIKAEIELGCGLPRNSIPLRLAAAFLICPRPACFKICAVVNSLSSLFSFPLNILHSLVSRAHPPFPLPIPVFFVAVFCPSHLQLRVLARTLLFIFFSFFFSALYFSRAPNSSVYDKLFFTHSSY